MSNKEITTTNEATGFVSVIERAITNPEVDVDKLERLLNVQERVMLKQAELSFNQAMARLQPKLPVIYKSKTGHNTKYAPYDEIDRQIRSLYTNEGFSISYNSKRHDDNLVTYYGVLSHVDGHSRSAEIDLPLDESGSKNAVQAKGSTMTYAKRYLLTMLFNIVTTDDNDGAGSLQKVSDTQVKELQTLIKNSGSNLIAFEKHYKIESLADLPERKFSSAKIMLEDKIKAQKKDN